MTPLSTLAESLAGTFPGCDDAPLALVLLRALARGEPVAPAALAMATDRTATQLKAALERWPNVQRDGRGRVVAFAGLSLTPTPHRFTVAGRPLYTWCAWDTLFLPALLGQPAEVESSCPVTGAEVRLRVEPAGVVDHEPGTIRVSFPPSSTTSVADITGSFCCHVHFLAGQGAADRWLRRHPEGSALTLEEAFELGRMATRRCRQDAA